MPQCKSCSVDAEDLVLSGPDDLCSGCLEINQVTTQTESQVQAEEVVGTVLKKLGSSPPASLSLDGADTQEILAAGARVDASKGQTEHDNNDEDEGGDKAGKEAAAKDNATEDTAAKDNGDDTVTEEENDEDDDDENAAR